MKTLIIDRLAFLDWYFQDIDLTNDIYIDLLSKKEYMLTLEDLLNIVPYIPSWVLVEGQQFEMDENEDVDVNKVSLEFN
jgi:hypothetical protein